MGYMMRFIRDGKGKILSKAMFENHLAWMVSLSFIFLLSTLIVRDMFKSKRIQSLMWT